MGFMNKAALPPAALVFVALCLAFTGQPPTERAVAPPGGTAKPVAAVARPPAAGMTNVILWGHSGAAALEREVFSVPEPEALKRDNNFGWASGLGLDAVPVTVGGRSVRKAGQRNQIGSLTLPERDEGLVGGKLPGLESEGGWGWLAEDVSAAARTRAPGDREAGTAPGSLDADILRLPGDAPSDPWESLSRRRERSFKLE